MTYSPYRPTDTGAVDTNNSSTAILTNGSVFTGSWTEIKIFNRS